MTDRSGSPRTPGRCWCGYVRVSHQPWAAGEFCTNLKCGCRHYSEKRRGGEVIENRRPPDCSFGPCEHGSYCAVHDHHAMADPFGQPFGHSTRLAPERPHSDACYAALNAGGPASCICGALTTAHEALDDIIAITRQLATERSEAQSLSGEREGIAIALALVAAQTIDAHMPGEWRQRNNRRQWRCDECGWLNPGVGQAEHLIARIGLAFGEKISDALDYTNDGAVIAKAIRDYLAASLPTEGGDDDGD